jgi:hypothetical protein
MNRLSSVSKKSGAVHPLPFAEGPVASEKSHPVRVQDVEFNTERKFPLCAELFESRTAQNHDGVVTPRKR